MILLATIALADFLIFNQTSGFNLFFFAMVLACGIVLMARRFLLHAIIAGLGASIAAAVPLLEAPTALAVAFTIFGLVILSLVGSGLMSFDPARWPGLFIRFSILAPFRLLADALRAIDRAVETRISARIARGAIAWVIPLIFAAIFVALFRSANPVIEAMLDQIDIAAILTLLNPLRMIFWIVVLGFAWPLFRPRLARRSRKAGIVPRAATVPRESALFGRAAMLRSLLVFNVLFAVQTLLDLTYLWGGADLPQGMTHADYVHRGAYPLMATALLAAGFVLWTMRSNSPGAQSRLIRNLVYLWIVQNILLCASSLFRLDLYVDVYALTELRLAAGIWMVLVAGGLALILLRILLRRSNAWLIGTNLAMLLATLYFCSLADFSAFIARFNVEHSYELTGQGVPLDLDYLSCLGPSSIPALDLFVASMANSPAQSPNDAILRRNHLAFEFQAKPHTWRSWSYRQYRLDTYLDQHPLLRPSSP
jgi:hypothetical protein